MFKVPEKNYTHEELIEKTKVFKQADSSRAKRRKTAPEGKELFLNTDEGKIRVLAYYLKKSEPLPLFVNLHGGGFILGSPEMDDPYMMNVALKANVKILNVDYSLAPQAMFPKAMNECYAVIKYAEKHSEEFGIDPKNIAIGGHSAGGNLSAAICLKNIETKELNIKCVILDYPPLDVYTDPYLKPKGKGIVAHLIMTPKISRIFNACYYNDKEERRNPLISPIYATPEQLTTFPPTLILTAGKDSLCTEAELFRDKLTEAGIIVTHKRFEFSPHGFILSNKRPDALEGWKMMIEHLSHWLFQEKQMKNKLPKLFKETGSR
jgi:acetyl esterase